MVSHILEYTHSIVWPIFNTYMIEIGNKNNKINSK